MPNKVKGIIPGFILIPAREYEWELSQKITLRLPNKGLISNFLNNKDLADDINIAGEDEFSIFEDGLLQLWELVRVLFARSEYPNLEDDQCLNVVALEFEEEEIIVHGEILKYI